MATKRRQFSREFKEEAVRLWAESGRPLAQIARELTVRTEQLRRWRRQLGAVKADPAAARETEAQELRRLRRELELTRQERDFLKKAAAFFANYLAALLDLGSRRVVGWATSGTLDQTLTQRALRRALVQRQPAAGLLHHSDRGTPYTAAEYRAALSAAHVVVSMSRPGDCWDNAVMESFFATLKTELVHEARWTTRGEATTALATYIEGWYNRRRRHSTLDYLSPAEYELRLRAA